MGGVIRLNDRIETKTFKKELVDIKNELKELADVYVTMVKEMGETNKKIKTQNTSYSQANKITKETNQKVTELTNLQKERQRIQNQAVSTMAKLQAADEKRNRTLQKGKLALQEKNRAIREEIKTNKQAKGSYDQLDSSLKRMIKEYQALGAAERKTAKGKHLQKNIRATDKELKKFDKSMGRHQRNVGNYPKILGGIVGQLGMMAGAFLTVAAAVRGIRSAINTIMDFSKAMDEVAAITGATSKEFESLKKNAMELGRTTQKTASEVAGLQKEFAKLGFSTKEIEAATEATISLSIAAGSDLAESARVAASTIRGFGLEAKDSQRIVDVMAVSFSSSALDLEKFSTAMATVAPVAKTADASIEQTTALLSVLSDAGMEASTAGTSLRNIFLELSKQGLTLGEAYEKLNTSTNKNATAMDLFGKRSATAAILLSENIDKANELTKSYYNSDGAAKAMADTMENNLYGDVKKMKSAWEGLILSLSEGEGILRRIVQNVTKLLGKLSKNTKATKEHKSAIDRENDAINEQISEANKLFKILKKENISKRLRVDLIKEANDKYGKYLSNLLSEKSTLQDIAIAQERINRGLQTEIFVKDYKRALEEISKKSLMAAEELIAIEKQWIARGEGTTLEDVKQFKGPATGKPTTFRVGGKDVTIKDKSGPIKYAPSEEERAESSKNWNKYLEGVEDTRKLEIDSYEEYLRLVTDLQGENEKVTEKYKEIAVKARLDWNDIENELMKSTTVSNISDIGGGEIAGKDIKDKSKVISQLDKRIDQSVKRVMDAKDEEVKINQRAAEQEMLIESQKLLHLKGTEAEKQKVRETVAENLLAIQMKYLNEELMIANLNDDEKLAIHQELFDKEMALEDAKLDKIAENAEKEKEIAAQKKDAMIEMVHAGADILSGIWDRQLQDLEKQKVHELSLVGNNESAKNRIEKEYAEKSADIRRKQASTNKLVSIFDATISTAVAVANALETDPTGILATIVGILGGLQVAAIIATPIPEFAKGTPKGGLKEDTIAKWSEKGREIVITPSGESFVSEKETVGLLPKGTQIIPNYETEKILAQSGGGITEDKFNELINETRRGNDRPINVTNVDERGFEYYTLHNNSRLKYMNKYMRRW